MGVSAELGSNQRITTRKYTGSLGAEVEGVDLATDFNDGVMAQIRQALLDHLVLFFPDQHLTPEQQIAFGRRWGELYTHPLVKGMDEYPAMLELKKTPENKKNAGGHWHSDQMYSDQPAMATMLYAKVIPSAGGDTMFTNQYLAYETLSPGMQRMLQGLRAVSYGDHVKGHEGKSREDYYKEYMSLKMRDPGDRKIISSHPVVRTHPETGRKSLYIGGHVQHFEDMTEEESRPLIDFLMAHSTRPEFTCRYRWKQNALAIWDNRCTQHNAINDYPTETRIMHRITLCGDTPY
jgi:taurine dioxygenase